MKIGWCQLEKMDMNENGILHVQKHFLELVFLCVFDSNLMNFVLRGPFHNKKCSEGTDFCQGCSLSPID